MDGARRVGTSSDTRSHAALSLSESIFYLVVGISGSCIWPSVVPTLRRSTSGAWSRLLLLGRRSSSSGTSGLSMSVLFWSGGAEWGGLWQRTVSVALSRVVSGAVGWPGALECLYGWAFGWLFWEFEEALVGRELRAGEHGMRWKWEWAF